MPLSSSRLGTAIKNALDTIASNAGARPRNQGESDDAYRTRLLGLAADDREDAAEAIANAVVAEITANAVVTGACPPNGGPLAGGRVT